MRYMVRFAHGAHAAIGFHDIPVLHDALVQTRAELGTARSHGCIRQWRPDARALWRFAPVGTTVVVHA
jgi:lipoprotein-anchoring transpeptidase ErfK/SrfK